MVSLNGPSVWASVMGLVSRKRLDSLSGLCHTPRHEPEDNQRKLTIGHPSRVAPKLSRSLSPGFPMQPARISTVCQSRNCDAADLCARQHREVRVGTFITGGNARLIHRTRIAQF